MSGLLLWESCTSGDIDKVRELLSDPTIDVNWGDPDLHRTPLYRAAGHGKLDVVKLLMADPRVEVNRQQDQGGTPLGVAAQQGFLDVVDWLLKDSRVDTNLPQNEGCTPLYVASSHGQVDVVRLMLPNPRIDVNKAAASQTTPFFIACQEGADTVVELMLNDTKVDINKSMVNGESPLWIAVHRKRDRVVKLLLASDRQVDLGAVWKGNGRNEEQQARFSGFLDLAKLLTDYSKNPQAVKTILKAELGILDVKAAELFALVILIGDGYFAFKPQHQNCALARYSALMRQLPLELQMTTCNLLFGLKKTHILTKHSEPEFLKWLQRE